MQSGFFDLDERLAKTSQSGDLLEAVPLISRFSAPLWSGPCPRQTGFFIRLSWMRFPGLNFSRPVPDETRFCRNSDQGRRGFVFPCGLARTGLSRPELVDAVGAPRQRNNEEEKEAIKSGKTADLAQQSQSCSKRIPMPVKYSKAKPNVEGQKLVDRAIPVSGPYQHRPSENGQRLMQLENRA